MNAGPVDCILCSLDIPADILDTNLFACLLIIVKPLTVRQIDARELGTRFRSFS